MNFTYMAVQTHLTPSYRLFSIQDVVPVCIASGHLSPKFKRFSRYFSSLAIARFGVAVSSQYPALGKVF